MRISVSLVRNWLRDVKQHTQGHPMESREPGFEARSQARSSGHHSRALWSFLPSCPPARNVPAGTSLMGPRVGRRAGCDTKALGQFTACLVAVLCPWPPTPTPPQKQELSNTEPGCESARLTLESSWGLQGCFQFPSSFSL